MSQHRFALSSRIRRLFSRVRALFGFGSDGQQADPFAGVRSPRAGRPSGRSSAVALLEPDDPPQVVTALSRQIR